MTLEKTSYSMPSLPWYEDLPASAAVRAGDLVFIAGQTGLDASGEQTGRGDAGAQARTAFERIRELLELAGGGMDDIVDLMSFHHDVREIDAVFEAARDFFAGDYPAWTPVGMLGCTVPTSSFRSGRSPTSARDRRSATRRIRSSGGETSRSRRAARRGVCLRLRASGRRRGRQSDDPGRPRCPGSLRAQPHRGDRPPLRRLTRRCHRPSLVPPGRARMVPAGDVQEAAFADIPLAEAPAWTAIGVPGLYRLGMLASWRAIADLSPGKRVAMTPASIWWKIFPISGGTKKEAARWLRSRARWPPTATGSSQRRATLPVRRGTRSTASARCSRCSAPRWRTSSRSPRSTRIRAPGRSSWTSAATTSTLPVGPPGPRGHHRPLERGLPARDLRARRRLRPRSGPPAILGASGRVNCIRT